MWNDFFQASFLSTIELLNENILNNSKVRETTYSRFAIEITFISVNKRHLPGSYIHPLFNEIIVTH